MLTPHTLKEYAAALETEQLLVESTLDATTGEKVVDCFAYDTRELSGTSLFLCKGAHFKEEYLRDALAHGAAAYVADRAYNVDAPRLIVSDVRHALVVLGRL